jgi:hypothetical protein
MRARVVAIVGMALLLAGCSATVAAAPSATPTPSPTSVVIHDSNPVRRTVTPPADARSVRIEVTCTGGAVSLMFGGDMQDRGTTCDATHDFSMPSAGDLDVQLDPYPDATFTVTMTFSRAAFTSDPTATAQCSAASAATSALLSADNGQHSGQLDSGAVHALMTQARSDIEDGPFEGEIGGEMSTLRTWLDANPEGDPTHAPLGAHISQLCADNGSPMILHSAYGG